MPYPGLSAAQILDAADAGAGADPVSRGTVLLAGTHPEWGVEHVSGLTLGERESLLLEIRRATFGDVLGARTVCPACGAGLAVDVPASLLRRDGSQVRAALSFELEVGPVSLTIRPPDGAVLACAAAEPDVDSCRRALVAGCVVGARGPSGPLDPSELPPGVVAAAGEAIVERDPRSEVTVSLTCISCGHDWAAGFDAGLFLWEELTAMSIRLVDDVDVLARAYHWSEAEILAMSSGRRRRYVERVAGDG
jgi:hypothetical protein